MRASGRVARKFPIAGGSDRLVLFSWSANPEPLQRNVARVDHHGNVIWRAELPGDAVSDCFVSLAALGEEFVATTYSGRAVRLDANGVCQAAVVDQDTARTSARSRTGPI